MSNINQLLIKALYNEFDPNVDIPAQVAFVNENYNSQDKFVEDFYKEYNVELTPDVKLFIQQNFGGFESSVEPTINVDLPGIPEEIVDFVASGQLSQQEIDDINDKFGDDDNPNYDYFTQTYQDDSMQILSGGLGEVETKYQIYDDLSLTQEDVEQEIDNELSKFTNPQNPAFNLSDEKINEILNIREELRVDENGNRLNATAYMDALRKQASKDVLKRYKQNYMNNLIQGKVDSYIKNNKSLFSVKEPSLKVGPASLKDQVNPVFTPLRETPDYDKFDKLKTIAFKSIDEYTNVLEQLNKDYEVNVELGEEIKAYKNSFSNEDFVFDAAKHLEMQDKAALYMANNKAISGTLPKLRLANMTLAQLNVTADLLGRNYDILQKNLNKITTGFIDIGLGATRVVNGAISLIPGDYEWDLQRAEFLDNISLKWDNYKTGVQNSYSPDIKFKNAFKNISSFGEFVAQEISTQIPIFTTMMASGGIAAAAGRGVLGQTIASGGFIGVSSAGQQYNTMTAQEMRDPFTSFSEAEKFLISAGYGAAEGVFGTAPSYFLLRNTAKALSGTIGPQMVKEGIKSYYLKNIGFPLLAEPLSEGLTQVTQNILLERPMYENVDHAAFSGLMFAFMMNSAPAMAGRMMQDFSDITNLEEFNKLDKKMVSIEKSLDKMKANDPNRGLLEQKYGELKASKQTILNDLYDSIQTKLTKKGFKDFLENTNKQQRIRMQAQSIVDNAGIFLNSEERTMLDTLQNDFNKIQMARDLFRSEGEFGNEFANIVGDEKDIFEQKALKNLKLKGITDPQQSQIFEEASNLYFEAKFDEYTKKVEKNIFSNTKVFQTNKELIEYIESNPELNKEFSKKQLKTFIKDGEIVTELVDVKQRILDGSLNGANVTLNVDVDGTLEKKKFELISKENSLQNERAGTGYHELTHSILFKMFGANPMQYFNIAKDIVETLSEVNPKLARQMFGSITGQQADISNPEEIIVNFIERVAEGKIDENYAGLVAESLSRESGLDINFRSRLDTVKFLVDMGLKIKDGSFSKADLEITKAGLKNKLIEANKEVESMEITQFSDSDANIVQKLYDNLGAEAAPQIANNKYVRNVINEVLRKYSNVPGYNAYKKVFEDGLINDPTYGILGSLLTYDSNRDPVLVKRIIFNLRQRSKTIAENIFPQAFTDDVTEVRNVTEDVTSPEVLQQRESLRISLGLSTDVINNVKQAVLKTFGGKLPNVTSKNFRSELQKSFRVFLKKTIAKNVLKQGAEYKAFLENNFEQIYSVLSQNTIRKRFKAFAEPVLDKDGKQLREKTAEGNKIFVKRKITKKEFVDYFLGDNVGRSTQGTRKTALAEALAQEIAFDASLDVLRDPTPIDNAGNTLLDRVEQIIEINGEQFSENYLAQVAKEIDRATGFKFSDSSAGITVLDFDDTVAVSKSKVIVELKDKTKKELTPAEFAKQHDALKKEGAKFDFSQFNKVIGGEKGPLFNKLQKAVNKFGNKNVFILTARPQEAAPAIKAWLKSQGIALSEKNIVGLSDGSPQAKADWILGKAQEGFNNFYFADDVLENTYAVEQVLSQVDVKYRVDSPVPNIKQLLNSFDGDLGTFDDFFKALIIGQRKYNINSKGRVADRKGQALEYYVSQEIKGILGDRVEIVNEDSLKILKTGDTGIDIRLRIDGGPEFGIEIKNRFTDRVGSKSGYSPTTEAWGGDVAGRVVTTYEELKSRLEDKLNQLNIPYETNKEGDIFVDNQINGKLVTDILKDNDFKFSDQELDFTMDGLQPVADLYGKKGGQYILFGDKGIFSLNANPLNLNVQSLTGIGLEFGLNTSIKTTLKTSSVTAAGKRKFFFRSYLSIVDSNGKLGGKKVPQSLSATDVFSKFSDSNAINLDNEINNIIEKSSGIKNIVRYSDVKGRLLGKDKGKGGFLFRFSADDLKGFTYEIIKGIRGAEGNAAIEFFKENIHRPFNMATQAINFEQMKLMDDFKALKKKIKSVPKNLSKRIEGDVYTNEQAIRIYMWKKQGMDIPGIPKQDVQDMVNYVKGNINLLQFANDLIQINGVDGYPAPDASWEAGTIEMDLYNSINNVKRAKHLKDSGFTDNVNIIFSEKNKNKMRAVYGNDFVDNLENILERMRTGRNRKSGGNALVNKWQDWINESVGVIMFYNMRSALLQTISAANYINWSDNNVLAAGKAFANQPQFWKDFLFIFNSDYLRIRRGGVKLNVNESELADAASKKGVKGVIALLLKNGFTPTRVADSLAISTGGSAFYRNRTNRYIKDGLTQKDAEKKAFEDFMELTEEGQQSSRPDKISAQQASGMGRILLAFANTPMQYNRLIKRAGQDLYYGRGDWKSNVSKIVYYSSIQNFIFNAMQKGLYALGFGLDEDDPEKQREKTTDVFEGMFDSLLRGIGIQGQVALTAKAFLKDFAKERQGFTDKNWDNLLELSPPIGSKVKKLMSADYLYKKYANSTQARAVNIRNPYLQVFANYASGLFNIPLDRALRKAHNIQSALAEDTESWQRIALFLGWNEWDLGIDGMERELGKTPIKTEEYIKEREETKEDHQRKIDSIVDLGYTRVPLSGPKSFVPEGKLGEDYLRLRRKIDGRYQYFVPTSVFNQMFPEVKKKPKTKGDYYNEAKERLEKKYKLKF